MKYYVLYSGNKWTPFKVDQQGATLHATAMALPTAELGDALWVIEAQSGCAVILPVQLEILTK